MIKTRADLHIGAEGNTRGKGSDEGEEGSDEDNAGDEEDMDEGAAKFKIEEISDVSEDDEGFTKMLPSPMLPTQKMIDLHNISHMPYASWCPAYVRGRGARYARKTIKERDVMIQVFCGNYFIF